MRARVQLDPSPVIRILDKSTWRTKALQILGAAGNLEFVYTFSNTRVNEPLPAGSDPLKPNLEGYRTWRFSQNQ